MELGEKPPRHKKNSPKHPKPQKKDEPQDPSRREFLKKAAIIGAGLVVAGSVVGTVVNLLSKDSEDTLKREQFFEEPGFQDWVKYKGNELPNSHVVSIADSLINSHEYVGFPEAGQVLKTAATNFQDLDMSPKLFQPLKIYLVDTISHGSVSELDYKDSGKGIKSQIINTRSGDTVDLTMGELDKRIMNINIEQNSIYGSKAVRALLIVKEISHLIHIAPIKQIIYDKFIKEFSLKSDTKQSVDDFLFNNANMSVSVKTVPEMSFEYRNANTLVDWAGYWHICPALGRMLKQKAFTQEDERVLAANIRVFKLAQDRDLILEHKPGVFLWKQNIGPFSPEFRKVMEDSVGVPVLKDPNK